MKRDTNLVSFNFLYFFHIVVKILNNIYIVFINLQWFRLFVLFSMHLALKDFSSRRKNDNMYYSST